MDFLSKNTIDNLAELDTKKEGNKGSFFKFVLKVGVVAGVAKVIKSVIKKKNKKVKSLNASVAQLGRDLSAEKDKLDKKNKELKESENKLYQKEREEKKIEEEQIIRAQKKEQERIVKANQDTARQQLLESLQEIVKGIKDGQEKKLFQEKSIKLINGVMSLREQETGFDESLYLNNKLLEKVLDKIESEYKDVLEQRRLFIKELYGRGYKEERETFYNLTGYVLKKVVKLLKKYNRNDQIVGKVLPRSHAVEFDVGDIEQGTEEAFNIEDNKQFDEAVQLEKGLSNNKKESPINRLEKFELELDAGVEGKKTRTEVLKKLVSDFLLLKENIKASVGQISAESEVFRRQEKIQEKIVKALEEKQALKYKLLSKRLDFLTINEALLCDESDKEKLEKIIGTFLKGKTKTLLTKINEIEGLTQSITKKRPGVGESDEKNCLEDSNIQTQAQASNLILNKKKALLGRVEKLKELRSLLSENTLSQGQTPEQFSNVIQALKTVPNTVKSLGKVPNFIQSALSDRQQSVENFLNKNIEAKKQQLKKVIDNFNLEEAELLDMTEEAIFNNLNLSIGPLNCEVKNLLDTQKELSEFSDYKTNRLFPRGFPTARRLNFLNENESDSKQQLEVNHGFKTPTRHQTSLYEIQVDQIEGSPIKKNPSIPVELDNSIDKTIDGWIQDKKNEMFAKKQVSGIKANIENLAVNYNDVDLKAEGEGFVNSSLKSVLKQLKNLSKELSGTRQSKLLIEVTDKIQAKKISIKDNVNKIKNLQFNAQELSEKLENFKDCCGKTSSDEKIFDEKQAVREMAGLKSQQSIIENIIQNLAKDKKEIDSLKVELSSVENILNEANKVLGENKLKQIQSKMTVQGQQKAGLMSSCLSAEEEVKKANDSVEKALEKVRSLSVSSYIETDYSVRPDLSKAQNNLNDCVKKSREALEKLESSVNSFAKSGLKSRTSFQYVLEEQKQECENLEADVKELQKIVDEKTAAGRQALAKENFEKEKSELDKKIDALSETLKGYKKQKELKKKVVGLENKAEKNTPKEKMDRELETVSDGIKELNKKVLVLQNLQQKNIEFGGVQDSLSTKKIEDSIKRLEQNLFVAQKQLTSFVAARQVEKDTQYPIILNTAERRGGGRVRRRQG